MESSCPFFKESIRLDLLIIARLSQSLWTTTPKNFYHPNQLSIRCVVWSFNSWLSVLLSVVVQIHWLNLLKSSKERQIKPIVWYSMINESHSWKCALDYCQISKKTGLENDKMSLSQRETKYNWHCLWKTFLSFSIRVQEQFLVGNWPGGIWKDWRN